MLRHQNAGTTQSLLLQVGVVAPHRADRVGEICHEVGDKLSSRMSPDC